MKQEEFEEKLEDIDVGIVDAYDIFLQEKAAFEEAQQTFDLAYEAYLKEIEELKGNSGRDIETKTFE